MMVQISDDPGSDPVVARAAQGPDGDRAVDKGRVSDMTPITSNPDKMAQSTSSDGEKGGTTGSCRLHNSLLHVS